MVDFFQETYDILIMQKNFVLDKNKNPTKQKMWYFFIMNFQYEKW